MPGYERENIARMTGYTWGEQPRDGETLKLNTNENPYPASPAVQAALASFQVSDLRRYPDPLANELRDLLASKHGLTRDSFVVTNGGDEALRLALTTFVDPGDAFGMAEPSYSLYPVLAAIQDARVVRIPLRDDWSLPRDFAQQLNANDVCLACLVNPHAPSGTLLSEDQVAELASEFKGVLLLDEAYADFIDPSFRYDAHRLVRAFDNLLILRTFSKGYSLAGLRLGYLAGQESVIDPIVTKTRDSYNIDGISQALGVAAIADAAYAEEAWSAVRNDRRIMRDELTDLGFHVPSSQANFLLASVPMDCPHSAQSIYEELKRQGILVRYFAQDRLDDKLRITIGTPEENRDLVDALSVLVR